MKKIFSAGLILLAFAVVGQAHAQFGRNATPRFYSDFKPVVGGWSEYQMTTKGQPASKMKIAIVGKEGDSYWYETVMEGRKEGRVVMKMLVSGNPADRKNVKRMILKQGNEQAMEMPVQMMQQGGPQSAEPRGKALDKGTETVKVPAGTFTAQHVQYQDGEIVVDTWVSKDISPYAMVKSQSKEFEMVLVDRGTGATTLITETPKKFEMPKMPRGMPKGAKPGKGEEDED